MQERTCRQILPRTKHPEISGFALADSSKITISKCTGGVKLLQVEVHCKFPKSLAVLMCHLTTIAGKAPDLCPPQIVNQVCLACRMGKSTSGPLGFRKVYYKHPCICKPLPPRQTSSYHPGLHVYNHFGTVRQRLRDPHNAIQQVTADGLSYAKTPRDRTEGTCEIRPPEAGCKGAIYTERPRPGAALFGHGYERPYHVHLL